MLSILLFYICYITSHTLASPTAKSHDKRACVEFFIPVKVSTQNAVYNIPHVNSNIDAVEYALQADTWSTPISSKEIIKNITIEDIFSIHAQLCTPNNPNVSQKQSFLQIATHGLVFDKR